MSYNPIRIVGDTPRPRKDVEEIINFRKAWYGYARARALNGNWAWWKPTLNNRWDKFRYWLHLKLIEWGVII